MPAIVHAHDFKYRRGVCRRGKRVSAVAAAVTCKRCRVQLRKSMPQKGVESKQPDKYAAHHLACITRVTGGLEGPCDCGVESSPQKGVGS